MKKKPLSTKVFCFFQMVSESLFAIILLLIVFSFHPNGARAAALGPLLPNDLQISTGETTFDRAQVAFDGSRYLVVWAEKNIDFDIYGQFIDTSGALSGSPFLIESQIDNQLNPSVAFNGTHYYVVWEDNGDGSISGRAVSMAGAILGAELAITPTTGSSLSLDIASDGEDFLVVWTMLGSETSGQLISLDAAGNAAPSGGNFPIGVGGGSAQFWVSVAFGATSYLVTWSDVNSLDIFGAYVSPAGTATLPMAISTAPGAQGTREAGIAFDGTNFLVVFDDTRDGTSDVFGTRISETGVLLDGPAATGGILISGNPGFATPHRPKVAFSGTDWLVVWGGDVQGARVSTGGVVLDPIGFDFSVTFAGLDPEVAFDGMNFLVTWRKSPTGPKFAQLVGEIIQPLANAGLDQTADEGSQVTLDGSASIGEDPLSFSWVQVGGPSVTLSGANTATPTFTTPFVPAGGTTLTFQLIVSDTTGTSAPDIVNITVKNVNNPPVADAGDDQTVQEGSPVTLDGSGSFDNDAEELTFSWIQVAGTLVTLSDPSAVQPTFTAPSIGAETLTFELTVSDGIDSTSETVNVFVTEPNNPPVADAGPDQTVNEVTPVTLDGSGSSDPDGDVLTFSWIQIGGPTVSLDLTDPIHPTFQAPFVPAGGATLTFELTVSDGDLTSDPDESIITVLNVNDPPACDLADAAPHFMWPPNHKLIPIKIVGVTDPDNDEVVLTVTETTQDEPINGPGDGDTSPDAVIASDPLLLRAEREGGGNGRVYLVTFTADDNAGGICIGTVSVCVPHDRRSSCVDDGQNFDSTQP